MPKRKIGRWICGVPGFASLAVLLGLVGLEYGGVVDWKVQESLYEGLRNTSAIIFGVMGAWIAVVYPGTLSEILEGPDGTESDAALRVRQLLWPMLVSTLILALILLAAPALAILKPSLPAHSALLKGVSFALLLVLTLCQFWALLYTLVPLGVADSTIGNLAEDKLRRRQLTSHQQRQSGRSPE